MQSCCVMAFRKRAKNRGYSSISIKFIKSDNMYLVSAIDPVFGFLLTGMFSESDLFDLCR